MTAFDRFEREIPELLSELAPARVPDYFDDMLRRTAGTRQRPSWSAPERWLPMGVLAPATTVRRRLPWRYLAIAVALLIIAAASLIYVGSRSPGRLPAPFGPAANGLIAYANPSGDLVTYNPMTGATHTIVSSDEHEAYPLFTNDGTTLLFARTPDALHESDYLADADGSHIRPYIADGSTIKWFDWSAAGDRAVVTREVDGAGTVSLVDTATGTEKPIPVDPALGITAAMTWPGHDELIYVHVPSDGKPGTKAWIGRADGSGLRSLPLSADAVLDVSLSPDGRYLVYSSWNLAPQAGRIHLVDLADPDAPKDAMRMFDGSAGTGELDPGFSPDSRSLVVARFDDSGYHLVILPVSGDGKAVELGPIHPNNEGFPSYLWSPDGTKILAAYPNELYAWLLPVDGSPGTRIDGMSATEGFTWQRKAP